MMKVLCPVQWKWVRGIFIGLLFVGGGISTVHAKPNSEPPIPFPGLTEGQLVLFQEGQELFEHPFRPREGLGPIFNARACVACHKRPTVGGHGPGYRSNLRFTEGPDDTTGILFHSRAILGMSVDPLPDASPLSKRRPTTLLGLGLVEAIPKEAILAYADPDDTNGDGIRGRVAIQNGQILRFGSQAHVGGLFDFVAEALREELGLTSPLPGFESEPENPALPKRIQIPQPNVSMDTVQKIVDFVAFLAPPPRGEVLMDQGEVTYGEHLFREAGCVWCHVPSYRTREEPIAGKSGPSPEVWAALVNQEVHPYSDFLLHDLGPALDDGVALGASKTSEFKTPALWGLRFRQHLLMHDGRANNIEQAILYHGGEAASSRIYVLGLSRRDRVALLAFLKSL